MAGRRRLSSFGALSRPAVARLTLYLPWPIIPSTPRWRAKRASAATPARVARRKIAERRYTRAEPGCRRAPSDGEDGHVADSPISIAPASTSSFADEIALRAMELVRWLNDSGWQVAADDRHAFAAGRRWSPSSRLEACDVMLCVITPGGWYRCSVIMNLPMRQARKIHPAGDLRAARPRPAARGAAGAAARRSQPKPAGRLSRPQGSRLSQAGSRIGRVAIVVNDPEPRARFSSRPGARRVIGCFLPP